MLRAADATSIGLASLNMVKVMILDPQLFTKRHIAGNPKP
jgi:hypothetical protein